MFFQFSPPVKKINEKVALEILDEPEILSLAPFTKNPKICFDNVPIGTKAVRSVKIQNPLNRDVQITVKFDVPEEIGAELSWLNRIIKKNEECELEIIWIPKNEGAWRHMLHLGDRNRIQRDIPVAFKSVISKKTKNCKTRTRTNCLPKFKTKSPNAVRKKSPTKSPKKRFVLPNITNLPSIVKTNYENEQRVFTKSDDKENLKCAFNAEIMDNFNWECDVSQVPRRNTYMVKAAVVEKNIVSPCSNPKFVDSLELDSSSDNKHSQDIVTKLGSMSFPLSPITPQGNLSKFEPSCCSTDEKSRNNTFLQIHSFERNTTFQIMSEINEKENISSDMCVKENNLSTETYVKGNLSSDTYTKADISSSTYVKDNSSVDISNFQFSPLTNDFMKSRVPENIFCEESNLRNCRDAFLSCIKEESLCNNTSACSIKRKSNVTFDMTPKKRINLGISDWSKKGTSSFTVSKKSLGLNINTKTENNGKIVAVTSTNTKEIKVKNPFLATAINNVDSFLASTVHYDGEWMDKQQENFKKWLNALLTPCELNSNEENQLDIEKIWEQCKKKEKVLAPTKELLSSKFHTNSKLISLRKSALVLFKSEKIQSVLCDVMKAVETDKLTVRQDRDIHLDLLLQSEIMSVILSYNSLWLRIGLETLYGEVIPMNSNSDLVALSNFILERFFKDPKLLRKYKTVHSPRYCKEIKKFILKKFLTLVFFLDKAKMEKLIQHDPCLFRKKSNIKESREILLKFAREALLAVGDITKYLKHFGYFVEHKQTYIDEFDYAVTTLGVDLRDGVRLTRICEIILLRNNLSKNLRLPAESRLRKVHNVKVVFDALEEAGFQICGEISPKDIVDGHKEKTLSFLWQIIYKFQAPLLIKCAVSIQNWWRSMPIVVKRNQLRKNYRIKDAAARKIQLWYKKLLFLRKLEQFIKIVKLYIEYKRRFKSAVVIQSYVRMYLVRKRFLKLRSCVVKLQELSRIWLASEQRRRISAAVKIQSYFRMFVVRMKFRKLKYNVLLIEEKYLAYKRMRLHKEEFENLKYLTIQMQNRFRAKRAGKTIRQEFLVLRKAITFVQQRFRAKRAMRHERNQFMSLKIAAVTIQRYYRAKLIGRCERSRFLLLKKATLIIQQRYRSKIRGRIERARFTSVKSAVVTIQQRFRAKIAGKIERHRFESLRKATIIIQKYYRAKVVARRERNRFLVLRKASIIIQQFYRTNKAMRTAREEFLHFRETVVMVQQRYRAKRAMRQERNQFTSLKIAAVTIQRYYRAKLIGRCERNRFLLMKKATLIIQQRYRSKIRGRIERARFTSIKSAVVTIQQRFRAKIAGKIERYRFESLKKAALTIQKYYRAKVVARRERNRFLVLRKASIIIQQRYRAKRAMRNERNQFMSLKMAAVTIQRYYRAKLIGRCERNRFLLLKKAALIIQQRYRSKICGRIERVRFTSIKFAVVTIQQRYRAKIVGKIERCRFESLKKAVLTIQKYYRAKVVARRERNRFLVLRKASIIIQQRYRAKRAMRNERNLFISLKMAAVTIQRYYRAKLSGRCERNRFLFLKKATVIIQQRYRSKIQGRIERARFTSIKIAVVTIQQRYRAKIVGKIERHRFESLKKAAVTIQKYYRAKVVARRERNRFLALRKASIIIQQFYRANKARRTAREEFLRFRKTVIMVQRRYRATREMRHAITFYQKLRSAAIIIQRSYRHYLKMKTFRHEIKMKIRAVIVIQKYVRRYLVLQRYADYLKPEAIQERRKQKLAAAKILAFWRGYKTRVNEEPEFCKIRKKIEKANKNALLQNTLGYRCTQAVLLLSSRPTVSEIIRALEDIGFLTRRCKSTCLRMSSSLSRSLYVTITSTNRSPPDMQACTAATNILIDFYRYPPSRENCFLPEFIDKLITVMLHWCDKEAPLFPSLCTLLWLFCHSQEYKRKILESPNFWQKMCKMESLCSRREQMVSKVNTKVSIFLSRRNLPLPSLKPDWGLELENYPKTFCNSVHGLQCLLRILRE